MLSDFDCIVVAAKCKEESIAVARALEFACREDEEDILAEIVSVANPKAVGSGGAIANAIRIGADVVLSCKRRGYQQEDILSAFLQGGLALRPIIIS
jgi:hypothetical protein